MALSDLEKPADSKDDTNKEVLDPQTAAPPYTLIFLNSTKNAPAGTEQTIDAAYVSLGRDTTCQVCYGDEFPMVSRLHAAIEWVDDNYSISHLSKTNQTLLNGRPIAKKWYLYDDDVIQLAPSGPKIKFKRPLILTMKEPVKPGSPKKKDLFNISVIALIALAILMTILMVYFSISG